MVSVSDAVESGDNRMVLVALRDRLARAIDDADTRDLPALVLRLTAVLELLEGDGGEEGDTIDDLARRRADRTSAAKA